jgi:hypothetical protein
VQDVPARWWVPRRLHDFRRVVLLSDGSAAADRARRLSIPVLRMQLPSRVVQQPSLPLLHAPEHAVHAASPLRRPALSLSVGRDAVAGRPSRRSSRVNRRREYDRALAGRTLAARRADPEPELALAHEALAGPAHQRYCLGEEDSHCRRRRLRCRHSGRRALPGIRLRLTYPSRMKPCRAALTRATASGKRTRIAGGAACGADIQDDGLCPASVCA